MICVKLPYYIFMPRKRGHDKKYSLSKNQYDKWHRNERNDIKKHYIKLLKDQLADLQLHPPINIVYQIFYPTKAAADKCNFLSTQAHFFHDALHTKHGGFNCLPEDNDQFINNVLFSYGGVDRKDPHVKAYIEEQVKTTKAGDIANPCIVITEADL